MIKKLALAAMVLGMMAAQASAADKRSKASSDFREGEIYVTPMLGLNSYAIPFGAGVEYAWNENIGFGATLMVNYWGEHYVAGDATYGYSNIVVTPAVRAAYHVTQLEVDNLDLYGGLSLGYSIYSYSWDDGNDVPGFGASSSGLFLSPFAGARYYLTPTIAVTGELHFSTVGDFTGAGALVGVTFRLQ